MPSRLVGELPAPRMRGREIRHGHEPTLAPHGGRAVPVPASRAGSDSVNVWIHLDADVFDETIMQAVDDPRPDGLA